MAFVHFTEKDYTTSKWSGGTTTQIAILPRDANYADRDFLWRISSATVDLEESDFTPLPDYQRWISTRQGVLTLSQNGGTRIRLNPYEVFSFDGADSTHSWGSCTDFNLMLRKGKTEGKLSVLKLSEDESFNFELIPKWRHTDFIVYCAEGSIEISQGENNIVIHPNESVLATFQTPHCYRIHAAEQAVLYAATIHHCEAV